MYKFTLTFQGDFVDLENVLSSIHADVSNSLSLVCEYSAKSAVAADPVEKERYALMSKGAKEYTDYFKALLKTIEVKQEEL